jgi:hypothetical protein
MPTLDTAHYYVIKNIFSPLRALTNVGGGSSVQLTPGPPTTAAQLWTELWAFVSLPLPDSYKIKSIQGGASPYLSTDDGGLAVMRSFGTYWYLSFLNTPGDPVASVLAAAWANNFAKNYALTFFTSGPTMNYVTTQPYNSGMFSLNYWQFSKTAIPVG